jgi:hypothetical protein
MNGEYKVKFLVKFVEENGTHILLSVHLMVFEIVTDKVTYVYIL